MPKRTRVQEAPVEVETEQFDAVLYEVRGPAAWLTVNRPDQRNAINPEVIEGLLAGLERAGAEPAVRCVVLTGAGDRAFCAGADLSVVAPESGRVQEHERRGRMVDLLLALVKHPQPVVARVNGLALAGGFGLTLACDLVVAADDAKFGTPEIKLGLWPYMISALIHRSIPRKIALEMMLTGRRLSAEEAARWGMVNAIVPRFELDRRVDELVEELARMSPLILRLGKESFYRAQDMGFEQALAYLNSMLTVNLESEDVIEGVTAFFQRRVPEWKGR
jgi:enoyl-CoA hydratase/carnithine racemase